ncbi:MAG: hypothetical protein D6770_05865 [Anaerolineae bacterium]|nr:MAG: hypothetical protein D6770_05865 [Anaerolineae bacterium]
MYHGNIDPEDIARALIAEFHRGNLRAQALGDGENMVVQIATRPGATAGGQTALTVNIQKTGDGVMVQIGKQAWLGVAASLGVTALAALRNPFSLLGRLDDLAQDIESLQLSEKVWQVIDQSARAAGASHQLSERLARTTCEYCGVANPVGEATCLACGAPLGDVQPRTCPHCGFLLLRGETTCPNCGKEV